MRRGVRRAVRAAAMAVVVVGVASALVGCQGDGDDPAPSPSVSASSSAPTPSPSEPTSSAAEAETAQEFIRRWITIHTEMQNTGDTAEFRKLSKGCQPCLALADQVDDIYAAGGFVETDGWTVNSFDRTIRSKGQMLVRADIENPVTRYSDQAGGQVETLRAGGGVIEFTIRREQDSFRMANLVEISTP